MKTLLVSLLVAALLGAASVVTVPVLVLADVAAMLFCAGLAVWTVAQYQRTPRPFMRPLPLRFPVTDFRRPCVNSAGLRLAA